MKTNEENLCSARKKISNTSKTSKAGLVPCDTVNIAHLGTDKDIFTSNNIAEPASWLISNRVGIYAAICLPHTSITHLYLYLKDIFFHYKKIMNESMMIQDSNLAPIRIDQ